MAKPRNKFEASIHKSIGLPYETKKFAYTVVHRYTADWVDESTKTIYEAKGRFTGADRNKMLRIKAAYPEWTIVMIFQNPKRKLSKSSKQTYSGWCDSKGISWTTAK